jgi:signal transduction histidine kinase
MNDSSVAQSGIPLGSPVGWWDSLSLAQKFTLASSALVLFGLGIMGFWVSKQIEEGIQRDVALRTELYMESFVAPYVQELAASAVLSAENASAIDKALSEDAMSMRILNTTIWNQSGGVLYDTRKEIVGQRFPVTDELTGAWEGKIAIGFDDEEHVDPSDPAKKANTSVLEIYVPIRDKATGKVIAIGEFYQDGTVLRQEMASARLESWAVTALVSLTIIAGLYSIVAKGSRTIDTQRAALASRVELLSDLLRQNEELRQRAQLATQLSAQDAEMNLRRLGSDLHDGVGQLLALSLLKLDSLFGGRQKRPGEFESIRATLHDAMAEIRDMAEGLALPEIEKLSLADALTLIVTRHEQRTLTKVVRKLAGSSKKLPHPVKLCLCRFVQEALNNAYKHAGGAGQTVSATWTKDTVVVAVSDKGPGFDPGKAKVQGKRQALGLIGLRNRIESLGGNLKVESKPGEGTRLTASLPVTA